MTSEVRTLMYNLVRENSSYRELKVQPDVDRTKKWKQQLLCHAVHALTINSTQNYHFGKGRFTPPGSRPGIRYSQLALIVETGGLSLTFGQCAVQLACAFMITSTVHRERFGTHECL
jgi:hypothetical protein